MKKKKNLPLKEQIAFLEYFIDVLEAGISVADAIRKYKLRKRDVARRFQAVYHGLKQGKTFSQAMKDENLFPDQALAVFASGESVGKLGEVSRDLLEWYKETAKLRSDMTKRLTMPAIEILAALVVTMFAFLKIIPEIGKSLRSLGKLPDLTMHLLTFSNFLRGHIAEMAAGIVIGMIIVYMILKDRLKEYLYKMPLIGSVLINFYTANLFYQIKVYLVGGYSLQDTLRKIVETAKSDWERSLLRNILFAIQKGESPHTAFEKTGVFPFEVINMLETASHTGKYKQVIERISESTRNRAENSADGLSRLIEPVVIILLGVVVFLIVMSVYYPIISITTTVR
jgi:type II secretory pathway component PulF